MTDRLQLLAAGTAYEGADADAWIATGFLARCMADQRAGAFFTRSGDDVRFVQHAGHIHARAAHRRAPHARNRPAH
jgi:hypothetical protein